MRRLAHLYLIFLKEENVVKVYNNAADMFHRINFTNFTRAVSTYTTGEDDTLKSGLKGNLYYLVKKTAKTLKGIWLCRDNDENARQMDDFIALLELMRHTVFADADNELNMNRQKTLRKPKSLPLEADVIKVRTFILTTLDELTNAFELIDRKSYNQIKYSLCCRLTLFNARRGGEPARLSLAEWKEANDDVWMEIAREELGDVSEMKITYQPGKGTRRLVPVMFPSDCVRGKAHSQSVNLK